jgi:hypothetical protein
VLPDVQVVFGNVRSGFSWVSSYDLMLMLLYVSLRVCNVLFSCCFLPMACPYVESMLFALMACLILLMTNYARLLAILIASFIIIIVVVMTLYLGLLIYTEIIPVALIIGVCR